MTRRQVEIGPDGGWNAAGAAIGYALLGVVSGALSAAAMDLKPLGDAPGITLFGYCIGVGWPGCKGAGGELYLFPGLVFGCIVALLLLARRRVHIAGALGFAIAATFANAAAVVVWTAAFSALGWMLERITSPIPLFAATGAIAGAFGGGLLGLCGWRLVGAAGWWRTAVAGGALGSLLPVLPMFQELSGRRHGGEFAFYMIWQGGYAAVLLGIVHAPGQNPSSSRLNPARNDNG